MYEVEWLQEALDELATLWLSADSALRQALNTATETTDQLLQHNPNSQGESRDQGRRVAFVRPLAVFFRVEDDRKVAVLGVRLIRKRLK